MNRSTKRVTVATLLLLPLTVGATTMSAAAQPVAKTQPAPAPKAAPSVEGISERRLDNGLLVLFYPDQSKPTVTVNLTVFVGSRHEGYGETGMAHLLEHMLFKGTPTNPDVWKALQDHGAKFNGTTWLDRTNYFEELPATSENLEFAVKLEADRMVNSTIAAEALAKEFSVVRNEFEIGENNPAGVLEEKMMSVAYQWHNYGKSTIGSRSDIERVPIENLRAFYRKFYQPDNAMVVVAGKFDEQRAWALVQEHFGKLPRPTRKLDQTWTVEPVQDGERSVTLRRTGDVAVVAVLYHGAAGPDPDWLGQDAIADILTNKPAGRLYKALVEKGLASEVYGYVYPTAEPGVLYVGAKVRPGGSPEKVRAVMLAVIEDVAKSKVNAIELERWRTKTLKEFELALTQTSSVGVALSDWAAMGDWRLFFLTRDRAKTIKATDVQGTAKKFLKESNRTVGMFLPTKAPDRAPLVEKPDVVAVMKEFKPSSQVSEGEVFVASTENIEKRTARQTLSGGLKLALLPKKNKGGAVRLLLVLRFGDEKTLKGHLPASSMIPQLLLRGSKRRTFAQLKDELDTLRAEVQIGSGRGGPGNPGQAIARVMTVRENLPKVISILGEVLREPAFARAEFEALRKEHLARLEEQLQDPMANGFSTLYQKIYPWPKGDVRHIAGVKESIEELKNLKLADLAKMHQALWGASHAQLAVVGDFDAATIQRLVTKELGTWKSPHPYGRVSRPYKETTASAEILNMPDKENAMVGVGHALSLRDDEPDYPAAIMANFILGGSMNSRLMNRIRQKEGLSYGTSSSLQGHPLDKSGMFFAYAFCAPANADKAMALMLEEINKIRDEGVGDKELTEAKQAYAQSWQSRLAEDDFVLGELAQGLFLDRTFAYWSNLNAKLDQLTTADVNAAVRKYIQPSKLARVKAGDWKGKS